MTTTNLKLMPYAQAHVIHADDGAKALISYVTEVATLDNAGWLHVNGLYSMTTRKHLSAFAKEFCGPAVDFPTIKHLANTGLAMNIYTGELKEV